MLRQTHSSSLVSTQTHEQVFGRGVCTVLEVSHAILSADQQEQEDQEQGFLHHIKQEGVKHAELGSFLDKLGGAIAGNRISTLDMKVCLQAEHAY